MWSKMFNVNSTPLTKELTLHDYNGTNFNEIFRTLTVDRKIQIKKRAEDSRAITFVVTRGTSYDAYETKILVGRGGKVEKNFRG